jgi:hypothetical protein
MNELPRVARWSLLVAIALGLFLAGLGGGALFVTQRLNPASLHATNDGTTSSLEPAIVGGPVVLYTNGNNGWASTGPTAPSQFTVASGPVRITELKTYHHVLPDGLPSTGTISLKSSDGRVYGPWQTTGSPSSDGLANAWWDASIDVELPAGIYTVIDSDPSTWSFNADSGVAGMFWISGLAPSGCGPGATATSGCEPAIVGGPVVLYTNGNNGWAMACPRPARSASRAPTAGSTAPGRQPAHRKGWRTRVACRRARLSALS